MNLGSPDSTSVKDVRKYLNEFLMDGRVIDSTGSSARPIWAVGALRRGELWESTAVPEIRRQAQQVAMAVLDTVAATSLTAASRNRSGGR